MISSLTLGATALLASYAKAAQPGAPAPVAAPMRDLDWGQLNFLHTTDVHGWHAGHLLESSYSADWGDYISFAEHMRRKADEKGVDLLVVDTGDRVEGNGLYDASSPKGSYTSEILKEQPIDIICTGNHELYQSGTVEREHDITVPNFKNKYIASNLDYIEPQTGNRIPQAQRYRKFTTKNQGLEVVALGFIFDFDRAANNSAVQLVEDTLKEEWFKKAIEENADIFVVSGHVGLRMKEFDLIFKAIRRKNWNTPIAFLGGHAHVRDTRKLDDNAYAIASGRYMETIGWLSVDGIKNKKTHDTVATRATASFRRRYIDNNLLGLYHHSGLNETTFPTEHGRNVTRQITKDRKALKLDKVYGCAPQDYWMSRAEYPSDASIFTLLENEMLPGIVQSRGKKNVPRLAIANTGMIRFDIFKGPFTIDSTYIVSPFVNNLNYIPNVSYNVAKKVLPLLNGGGKILASSNDAHMDTKYLLSPEQWPEAAQRQGRRAKSNPSSQIRFQGSHDQRPLGKGSDDDDEPDLTPGYTTQDDMGDDGDDTEHSAIDFYAVPPCIQSTVGFPAEGEPDRVDIVFVDFVQPWIILALQFSGGDYSTDDVMVYSNSTMTDLLSGWISENWKGDC